MTCWSLSIKIWIIQAYRMHYSKKMSWCETDAKICAIGETECEKNLKSLSYTVIKKVCRSHQIERETLVTIVTPNVV